MFNDCNQSLLELFCHKVTIDVKNPQTVTVRYVFVAGQVEGNVWETWMCYAEDTLNQNLFIKSFQHVSHTNVHIHRSIHISTQEH